MNSEQQTTPIKNKGGRPRKDKKGVNLWIPAEYVPAMKAFFEMLKQQDKQAKP